MNCSRRVVEAALALGLGQVPLDEVLHRDAGVVHAGQPQHVVAAHPGPARQRVHHRLLERVAQVQVAGHVRRRDDDRVRRLVARRVGGEVAALLPPPVQRLLDLRRRVLGRQVGAGVGRGCHPCILRRSAGRAPLDISNARRRARMGRMALTVIDRAGRRSGRWSTHWSGRIRSGARSSARSASASAPARGAPTAQTAAAALAVRSSALTPLVLAGAWTDRRTWPQLAELLLDLHGPGRGLRAGRVRRTARSRARLGARRRSTQRWRSGCSVSTRSHRRPVCPARHGEPEPTTDRAVLGLLRRRSRPRQACAKHGVSSVGRRPA